MDVTVSSHNPARDDAAASAHPAGEQPAGRARGYAVAGLLAAVTAFAGGVCAGMVDAVYRPELVGDPEGVAQRLAGQVPLMIGFHVLSTTAALLLMVFGVGLHGRLRRAAGPDSLAPALAAAGVVGTSIVMVIGGALNTEFIFGIAEPGLVDTSNAALYNHWIGTVPAVWALTGLSGLAMWSLSRRGVVARWLGWTGLVLGSASLLVSVAPLQYMAGATGALWLLVTAVGLLRP